MNDKLLKILDNKKIFKLVLGLGNQSYEEIKNLCAIYAKAGCDLFDVNASEEAVKALYEGLEEVGIQDTMICISVGLDGDTHTQKAVIDASKCIKCRKCIKCCPQEAISIVNGIFTINQKKCIGCQKCDKCPKDAISFSGCGSDLAQAITLSKKFDIACAEIHVSTKKPPLKEIKYLLKNLECPLSLCLDRKYYSNEKVKKLVNKVIEHNGSPRFIIQADGVPMSGGDDDYKSTLQAVATAHLVQDFGTYILISGGTNSKTAELAEQCGVRFNGISAGSYARKIVKGLPFEEAVERARLLIDACRRRF